MRKSCAFPPFVDKRPFAGIQWIHAPRHFVADSTPATDRQQAGCPVGHAGGVQRAVSLLLESAKELDTTSLGRLHREAYHRIKSEVSLPSESPRVAPNQTCHIMRSWKARLKRGCGRPNRR